jgi:transposase
MGRRTQTTTPAVLGVDIGKKNYVASLLLAGKRYHHTFRNEPAAFAELHRWLAKHGVTADHPCQVCMEATGIFWEALAEHLVQTGHRVSVVNPARIAYYGRSELRRNKTDKEDADLIADFCATQHPPQWTPPPPEVRGLRDLVRHREDLLVTRTQEHNRLQDATVPVIRQMLNEHLVFLASALTEVEQMIQTHIAQSPSLQAQYDLLRTIKGIGPQTAAKLLSENIQSFTSTRALTAYAGLNPQLHQSGDSVRKRTRLSKLGSAHLRHALYMPALVAIRHNPIIQALAERLRTRNKSHMAIVGAAMRKLLCLALGVLKSKQPFDPHYQPPNQLVQLVPA